MKRPLPEPGFLLTRLVASLLAAACTAVSFTARGQGKIALPQIFNYNSEQYKGGLQNWDVDQDSRGIMYFGNNEGLLTFDGRYWNIHALPNATVVRSVAIDKNDRIYVGGQDELGYFKPDPRGILRYHSLVPLVPEQDRKFADIWNIVVMEDEIFFRSNTRIFQFKDSTIRVDKAPTQWQFLGKVAGSVYAQDQDQGIMQYENGFWKPLANHPVLSITVVSDLLPYNTDTLLVATLKNGLFYLTGKELIPKRTTLDEFFRNNRIYSGLPVNEDWFVFGTTSAGVVIMDRSGQLMQHYLYGEGLQKNNIRKVFIDRSKNLWLALDDGVDFVALNSAVKYIQPDKNNPISSYAFQVHEGNLYIGTSNGLYTSPIDSTQRDLSLSDAQFGQVENTEGQVWGLYGVNGRLLMGHEEGAFLVEDGRARSLYAGTGTWMFLPLSRVYPAADVIAGTYFGLQHLRFKGNRFSDGGRVSGPYESLRFILYDSSTHTVWASHPYRGIFSFTLSQDNKQVVRQKTYTQADGLPDTFYNYIFRIKNKITAATNDGIYEYDRSTDRFVPSDKFRNRLRGVELQYLNEDQNGNIWFISHKKLGVADFNRPSGDSLFSITWFPELNGKVLGGFESIHAFDQSNIFIGANRGAIHLNYGKYLENVTKPDVLLSQIRVSGPDKQGELLYGGYQPETSPARQQIGYKSNSFHFAFSSTLYDQQENVEFCYMLEGFDRVWSSWSDRSEKDYTNLPPGDYTFKVRSRNSAGNESNVVSYRFTILPAWYNSPWSYVAYFLLAAATVYLVIKWQKRRLEKQHQRQLYLNQLELDRSEKEVVRLRNEKLEAEISFKNRELANMTMHLIQRGEVLSKVRETILSVVKSHDFSDSNINFRQLIRLIRNVERTDEDWEQFSIHFNHVNEGFFSTLKENYPDLTPNELKLCAFLRLNLSSKEIAQLMNITIKGVEVGRYRLRKKLKLHPERNLYEFLLGVSSKGQHKNTTH